MLVPIQDVNDRSGLTDSSSDNGSYSAGANTFGGEQWEIEAPLPAHNHMVGQPWDVSGTATDYSLKVPILHCHMLLQRKSCRTCSRIR